MSSLRLRLEGLDVLRVRVLRETGQALLYGLEHPETTTRIPVIEVGSGAFPPRLVEMFWAQTLGRALEQG